jgi:hypothetical protein
MVGNLRQRLAAERQCCSELRSQLSESEYEKAELMSSVTKAQIEMKTEQIKMANVEEKFKREHSLLESQLGFKLLNMEAAHTQQIENMKNEGLKARRSFLSQICTEFRDDFDFSQKICNESVLKMLHRVSVRLQAAELSAADADPILLSEIRRLLKISSNSEIVQGIERLLSIRSEFEKSSSQLHRVNELQASVDFWDTWGRRMHTMTTDGFAIVNSAKDLQFTIEEALLTVIGQKVVWRRAEILRIEKRLLLQGLPNEKARKISVNSIGLVISAIWRLRKLSGHMNGILEFSDMRPAGRPSLARQGRPVRPIFRSCDQ